jgi:hypothetical protein
MSGEEAMLMRQEVQAARRLARLFRIERSGCLARRPGETGRQFLDRRGVLVDELARLEAKRQSIAPGTPTELDLAMDALRLEVDRAEQFCLALLARLGAELGRLRGEGRVTGLRDSASGQLLGRG